MKKNRILYQISFKIMFLMVFGFILSSCKEKFKPDESFIKVYDDKDVNKNYFPLGMKQTSDQGYLILSAYNGWNIHLMKTDRAGNLLWKYELPSKYVNAIPTLIERNDDVYFLCMDAVGLFTYVMKIDENNENASEFMGFQDIQYPMFAHDNENEVYIQNYNRTTFETGLFELNSEMTQIKNVGSVQIYTNVEDKVVDHLNYTGKRFPFSVSVTPEKDYILLSGFNNYSFSTVFMDANLEFSGVYNGAAFDGGLNAILPMGGNRYALARYSFTNLYYNPSASLNPQTIDIAESIPAQGNPELDAQSPVLIRNITINNTEYVVYLATTKSNQLLLNFYKKGSDQIVASKYFGESTPLLACDFTNTNDYGLMILARTTVMGSFNRIATIKLSDEELGEIVE